MSSIAAIKNSRDTVVQYNYDAWGNHKVLNASGVEIVTIGNRIILLIFD